MKSYTKWVLFSPLLLVATPNAPEALQLLPTKTTVTLKWQDASSDEAGFKIYRDGKLIMITQPNITTFKDEGLMPLTTYEYEVKATDEPFEIHLTELKAFPTAVGVGANVTGGRGGDVYYVTRLDGGGTGDKEGTFREGINHHSKTPRTILFALGGLFDTVYTDDNVKKNLFLSRKSNFTIAGQSANDLGGVHFLGNVIDGKVKSFEGTGLGDKGLKRIAITKSHNFSMRYISAKGPTKEPDYDASKVNNGSVMDLQGCNNVIVDHFSGGFASYILLFNKYNEDTNRSGDFTLQNSFGHEGWGSHNVALPTGFPHSNANKELKKVFEGLSDAARYAAWSSWTGKYDAAYNAYVLINHRQPLNTSGGKSGSFVLTSNYIYHWGSRLGKHSGNASLDLLSNLFEKGTYNPDIEDSTKLYKMEFATNIDTLPTPALTPSLYADGNAVLSHDGTAYNLGVEQRDIFTNKHTVAGYGDENDAVANEFFRSYPQSVDNNQTFRRIYPAPIVSTDKVKSYVLNNAGAGVRFYASGVAYNVDELDKRYIEIAKNKTGPSINYKKEKKDGVIVVKGVGGIGDPARFYYPEYKTVARGANNLPVTWDKQPVDVTVFDKDKDGMPDVWEDKYPFLDKNVADNNGVHTEWLIGNYKVINTAGYTNLEMYLADIAGDFHVLAQKALGGM